MSLTFGSGRPFLPDPMEPSLERMQADLTRPYQMEFRPGLLARGRRNTFTEMSQALLEALQPFEGPLDMILVVNSVPDADPRRSPSCYLADAAPGDALAFNVSDQGTAGPFTALRLVTEYARADAFRHALVVILDQRSFPYDTAGADGVPDHDSAVGLVLGPTGPAGEPTTRQRTDVSPGEVPALLNAGGGTSVVLVAGEGIEPDWIVPGRFAEVIRAPEGRPCTGPWSALADALPRLATSGRKRLVVADYDRVQRYLCLSTMELEEDL
ncbi:MULTISPECIES: hypothetical protein [Thermomonosporaceae]|uniref:hypothetical protein n=1 Tax=Thermomonosporaceae TaxID=2012 RepID=UPI00255A8188|nr:MULTISPECIES: hypothetical protein [Thermomonosporaceae]MDL4774217.1 hypothetical protein [Actinomadura xylanilytica]